LNAIGGSVAWAFDDETLRAWLSRGVLVDGPAALVLIARGFGSLIGFTSGRMVPQSEVLYTTEHCLDAEFAVRAGARVSVNTAEVATHLTMGSGQDPLAMFQGEPIAGARTVSDLRGPRHEVVGHGLVLTENDLGGRSAVVPWSVDAWVPMTIYRAAQLTRTLDWLERGRQHGYVPDASGWLVPQFLSDGDVWRGAVWNAGPDEVTEFTLRLPADMPAPERLVHVDARARRHDARLSGERVTLTEPLRQWETVLLV